MVIFTWNWQEGLSSPALDHKPGNDLFIVWNRGWKRETLTRDDLSVVPDSELLAVKLGWTFRK